MIPIPHLVLGGGGHARVVIDALQLIGANIVGIIDPKLAPRSQIMTTIVLGGDDAVHNFAVNSVWIVNGIGSTGDNSARRQCFLKFKELGYSFAGVVHPSACVARNTILGEGSQIMAGVTVQTGVKIGENSILNTRSSIDHDCVIGSHVHIAPGVILSGGVRVGSDVHIGTGAVVIQGVTLSDGAFIGAGSIVTKDVPSNSRVYAAKTNYFAGRN